MVQQRIKLVLGGVYHHNESLSSLRREQTVIILEKEK